MSLVVCVLRLALLWLCLCGCLRCVSLFGCMVVAFPFFRVCFSWFAYARERACLFVLLLNSCGVCVLVLRLVFQHRALQLFVQPQLVVKMLTCVVRLLACLRLPVCLCVVCALGLLECLFVCLSVSLSVCPSAWFT